MPNNPLDLRDWENFGEELVSLTKIFPESIGNFLKEKAKELSELQKKKAAEKVKSRGKREVKRYKRKKGYIMKAVNYHDSFNVGKLRHNLKYGMYIRAYNSSPHGHLIELGYKTADGGFVPGKNVIASATNELKPRFEQELTNLRDNLLSVGSPEYKKELEKQRKKKFVKLKGLGK